eukprot:SAG11_NODE_9247_length_929_cov_0.933735_1_plen_143_part_00
MSWSRSNTERVCDVQACRGKKASQSSSTLHPAFLALYEALRGGETTFLEMLARAPRDVVIRRDVNGLTLLHWACHHRASERVVQALLAADPSAAYARSAVDAALPLHVAAKSGCSIGTIASLFGANPSVRCETGKRLASARS